MDKKFVNLLQERGAPPTFWEKLYDWVTNTARIVIIITQLLIICAFGWRFKLDRTLNDLKEDIAINGGALRNLSDQEFEIRQVQTKVNTYSQLWTQSSNLTPVLSEVIGYLPEGIEKLKFLIINKQKMRGLTIEGETIRSDVHEIESSLKGSDNFKKVLLTKMDQKDERGEDSIWEFTITANIILNNQRQVISTNADSES